MSRTSQRYLEAADKMAAAVARLKAVRNPTQAQIAALITDLETEVRDLRLYAENLIAEDAADDAVVIPDGLFTGSGEDDPAAPVYIVGGSPGNPNGVSWTVPLAIQWFTYVWKNRVGYHNVRPTLLPGSKALTPEGLAFAQEFQKRTDLTEAPEDFNPLGLPVIA